MRVGMGMPDSLGTPMSCLVRIMLVRRTSHALEIVSDRAKQAAWEEMRGRTVEEMVDEETQRVVLLYEFSEEAMSLEESLFKQS
ncbi:MAG: hypothetical protein ACI906_002434 [Candidatus Latescibacterota bacterium]|jgi:hypothetical protein